MILFPAKSSGVVPGQQIFDGLDPNALVFDANQRAVFGPDGVTKLVDFTSNSEVILPNGLISNGLISCDFSGYFASGAISIGDSSSSVAYWDASGFLVASSINGGTFTNTSGQFSNISGQFTNDGGDIDNANGYLSNDFGQFINDNGFFQNTGGGNFDNTSGSLLNPGGNFDNTSGQLYNTDGGLIHNDAGSIINSGGSIDNSAGYDVVFIGNGNVLMADGPADNVTFGGVLLSGITNSAATSGTVSVTGNFLNETLNLTSGTTILSLTANLTAMPVLGKVIIHGKSAVTALTVTATGSTFEDTALTTLAAGANATYQKSADGATIIRLQ